MAVTAWLTPPALSNDNFGWDFVGPIITEDGNYGNQVVNTSSLPQVTGAYAANAFGIPAGAIINGVELKATGYTSAHGSNFAATVTSGSKVGYIGFDIPNGSTGGPISTTLSTQTAGGATSPFGYAPSGQFTAADWNAALTVLLFFDVGTFVNGDVLSLDNFAIRVHYTPVSSAGPNSPSAAASSGGSTSWTNASNVYSSNDSRATLTFPGSAGTTAANYAYLNATGFGFNIPTGATIQAITADIEMQRSGGSTGEARTNTIQLLKAGTATGTNKSAATNIGTTDAYRTVGGDLWGTTWTPAQINASNFGITVRPVGSTATTNRIVSIDHVRLTVTYTGGTVVAVDPYWSNVAALLHFDGANGSTAFPDVTGRTWTPHGDLTVSTTSPAAGTGSGYFLNDSAYLDAPSSPSLKLGNADFTVEAKVLSSRADGSGYQIIFNAADGTVGDYQLYVLSGTGGLGWWSGNGLVTAEGGSGVTDGAWHHLCVMRKDAMLYGFIDGAIAWSQPDTTNHNYVAPTITIGNYQGNDSFNGRIDEVRVTPGVARYATTGFTAPTEAFPDGAPTAQPAALTLAISGAGTASLPLAVRAPLAFVTSGAGTTTFQLAASSSFGLVIAGASSTSLALSVNVNAGLQLTGAGTTALPLKVGKPLAFVVTGAGTSTLPLAVRKPATLVITGAGTTTFGLTAIASGSLSLIVSGVASATLPLKVGKSIPFAVTGAGTTSLPVMVKANTGIQIAGAGTTSLPLTVLGGESSKADNYGFGYPTKGRHVNESNKLPKIVKPETKKEAKLRKAEQAKIDALKASIKIEAIVDPRIAEGLEAARLIAEFERLQAEELRLQLLEEEQVMLMAIQYASNRLRRNPFKRLIT